MPKKSTKKTYIPNSKEKYNNGYLTVKMTPCSMDGKRIVYDLDFEPEMLLGFKQFCFTLKINF